MALFEKRFSGASSPGERGFRDSLTAASDPDCERGSDCIRKPGPCAANQTDGDKHHEINPTTYSSEYINILIVYSEASKSQDISFGNNILDLALFVFMAQACIKSMTTC